MSGSATYGWNGKPVASVGGSGSHTVAAGRYAFVTAFCRNGGTITFNGTMVLGSAASDTPVAASFWVVSGTAVTGTGDYAYWVSEYTG